jgi:hypothetical protein
MSTTILDLEKYFEETYRFFFTADSSRLPRNWWVTTNPGVLQVRRADGQVESLKYDPSSGKDADGNIRYWLFRNHRNYCARTIMIYND